MPLELQPATEADARRSADIEAAAYAPDPFNKILFPGPFPLNVLDGRASLLVAELKADPTTRWLKVVDTDLPDAEQMIAFAKFHIYPEKPQLTPRAFGSGCNAEACEMVFGGLMKQRVRIMEDRPYVYLSLLHTDPKRQGRGAGGMLVRRIIEEAQKLGLVVYLSASPAGHELYKKCGFRDVETLSINMSKWGATGNFINWSMIWEPSEAV
ncbi:acyl-CoA N-acyltransferase [Hypoxylon sp. FL1857]|nr:acyl-CoA N-acyltransferase [Hypoxylon sp. FL1857]